MTFQSTRINKSLSLAAVVLFGIMGATTASAQQYIAEQVLEEQVTGKAATGNTASGSKSESEAGKGRAEETKAGGDLSHTSPAYFGATTDTII